MSSLAPPQTCPISLDPIPEGAAFDIQGTAFDVRSVLDMVLVQGSMAAHPYTREPIPRETFRRLHGAAMAFPETARVLAERRLTSWPDFAAHVNQAGGQRGHEMLQSSVQQAFETAWSRIIDATCDQPQASFGGFLERLVEDELAELLVNMVRLQGPERTRRTLLDTIERRCDSTTCIETLMKLHRLAAVVTIVLERIMRTHIQHPLLMGGFTIIEAAAPPEMDDEGDEADEADEGDEADEADEADEGDEADEAPPESPGTSAVHQLMALGQLIFGSGIVRDVVERASPAIYVNRHPIAGSAASVARGAGAGTSLPHVAHAATPAAAAIPAADAIPAAAPAAAAPAAASPAASPAAASPAASPAAASPAGSGQVFFPSVVLGPAPEVRPASVGVTAMMLEDEWLMHLVAVAMYPATESATESGTAFITARLTRTIHGLLSRWPGRQEDALQRLRHIAEDVERETTSVRHPSSQFSRIVRDALERAAAPIG